MDKHLQGHGQAAGLQLALNAVDVPQAELAGQHHPLAAQVGGLGHPGGAGDRHLGGTVQGQARRQQARQPGQADVLHDQGIDAGPLGRQQQLARLGQLLGEHQHVHGEKALDAAGMQPGHHLRQIAAPEVLGPQPGVEGLHAEVDGIGAIGDRRLERLPGAGR